jgi:hypothetical protein
MDLKAATLDPDLRRSFLPRLHAIYAAMDRAYDAVAAECGFVCSGCANNCCWTRFHHHTVLEFLDLYAGLDQLAPDRRRHVTAEARQNASNASPGRRQPCPLLCDQRCLLYARRPMICRLHGIPHQLVRPDATVLAGDGCGDFHARCGPAARRLDRTPFYRRMAALEKELRQAIDFSGRVNLTVAEMIVSAGEGQAPS